MAWENTVTRNVAVYSRASLVPAGRRRIDCTRCGKSVTSVSEYQTIVGSCTRTVVYRNCPNEALASNGVRSVYTRMCRSTFSAADTTSPHGGGSIRKSSPPLLRFRGAGLSSMTSVHDAVLSSAFSRKYTVHVLLVKLVTATHSPPPRSCPTTA